MKIDYIERALLAAIVLVFVAAALTNAPDAEQVDFDARWDRCTELAHRADANLDREDIGQMVEDCMDDGGPIEGLSVR